MKTISIAIVGSESLAGKELREVLRARHSEWRVHLIGADEEETGKLTEEGDEAVVITALDTAGLASADAVILAGSPASGRKAYDLLQASAPNTPLIDLTRSLEDIPSARLCAPGAGVPGSGYPAIVAHPAALALASFHGLIAKEFPIRRWLAEVFQPASELGKAGIDELHQQTVRLFSFHSLPKEVYDTQLAFSMLAAFGEESPHSLQRIEETVERHLASLLASNSQPRMPSLRLLQAPVFHGHMTSAWVEFEAGTTVKALQLHLRTAGIDVRGSKDEPPGNPSIAGQDGLIVGDIRADRNCGRAFWFWIASDNLRLPAANAVQLVEQVCA